MSKSAWDGIQVISEFMKERVERQKKRWYDDGYRYVYGAADVAGYASSFE